MSHKDPEVRKAYLAEYNEKNKEILKAKRKAYYEANKERHTANCKAYVEANKEKTLAYKKQWYEDNKVAFLARCKEYRESHKEQNAISQKAWREANPERVKARSKESIKRYIDNLSDYYVKLMIRKGTQIKSKDIPQELVEAKHVALLLEREFRETFKGQPRNPEKLKQQWHDKGVIWRANNKERKRAMDKAYRETHKERHNELNKLSRARVKARKAAEVEAQTKLNQEGVTP